MREQGQIPCSNKVLLYNILVLVIKYKMQVVGSVRVDGEYGNTIGNRSVGHRAPLVFS